jgi:hypothetical protein
VEPTQHIARLTCLSVDVGRTTKILVGLAPVHVVILVVSPIPQTLPLEVTTRYLCQVFGERMKILSLNCVVKCLTRMKWQIVVSLVSSFSSAAGNTGTLVCASFFA